MAEVVTTEYVIRMTPVFFLAGAVGHYIAIGEHLTGIIIASLTVLTYLLLQ